MQRKNKIIFAVIAGFVVFIPIVVIVAMVLSISAMRQSAVTGAMPAVETAEFPLTQKTMMNDSVVSSDLSFSSFYGSTAGETAAEVDQKIIKTGYLDIVVEAVDESAVKITALVTGAGGYIQDSSLYEREDGTKWGSITVRVTTKEFEKTLIEIKKLATAVNTETASGQDVTEEYTDLEARLKNSKAQEAEYLEILKKAVTVEDILNVQNYLGQTRQEIESLQGRIKYLENLTSYSTISVSLSEEPTLKIPSKEFRPWSTVKEAGQALIALGQNLIIYAIWFAILGGGLLLPIVIIAGLITLGFKMKRRKQKR
ncbi:MAG: hypothetical protein UX09_C0011G0007 [Candidatus Uhrbacteria bacterium GW2011_GWE2_45_35]|uniref:DUF4349 domain-containing protein n=2 Tax=Candidatus Uhriibacteriota TaxID=1752732 RepID=A0A0G1LSL5_9BACT|nr:MAG: hypothetical protein UW63_C0007G0014 [Candidatus Uhrbacteria bacterium GW2011_GWF2_44_350]KKU08825.1 MAG: hypothetical protein UX09_C0011G0007 [Candidatus Uhrbacteria bacterium GW2011_GWE2_45_35]HBR80864.1 hypothetical protein [Candidatus Uhrbacteria bacterium]HCU32170.1 hypothetical protein [Candidatus Uhrbacteria bacterium]